MKARPLCQPTTTTWRGSSVYLEAEAGKFDHVGNSSEARERNEGLMHRPIAKSKACRGGCGLPKCISGNHTSKPATKLKYLSSRVDFCFDIKMKRR